MTPEERAELRRLAEAASPERSSERIEVWRTGARSGAMREEDGAFYVAARTAVPALLDEVERLRAADYAVRHPPGGEGLTIDRLLADPWAREVRSSTSAAGVLLAEVERLRAWEAEARAAIEDAAAWADHAGTCLIEMRRTRGRPAAESDCDCYRATLRAVLARKVT